MSNVVDHPLPCMSSPLDATTMTVSLAPFGMTNHYEPLIVVPSPEGNHVVACLMGLVENGNGCWEVDPEPFA